MKVMQSILERKPNAKYLRWFTSKEFEELAFNPDTDQPVAKLAQKALIAARETFRSLEYLSFLIDGIHRNRVTMHIEFWDGDWEDKYAAE